MQNEHLKSFIKIPIVWEVSSRKSLRNYARYVYYKTINQEGRFKFNDLEISNRQIRNHRNDLKLLVSLGWAEKKEDYYFIKSYQFVWRSLGIEPLFKKSIGKRKFFYKKVSISQLPKRRRNFVVHVIRYIEMEICDRKLRQIRYSLIKGKNSKMKSNPTKKAVSLSADKVACMLGYKSHNSGNLARQKYFRLVSKKSQLIIIPTKRGKHYRFECKKVYVNRKKKVGIYKGSIRVDN